METVGETCSNLGTSGSDASDTLVSVGIVVLPATPVLGSLKFMTL